MSQFVIDLHSGEAHQIVDLVPCPECRRPLVLRSDGYHCEDEAHLLDHHLVALVAMAELDQPFRLQDCARFYGEPRSFQVSPSLRLVLSRLVAAGRVQKLGSDRYGVV